MTFEQAAIIFLLVGMLVVFALDRFRMEVVAFAGLAIGAAVGLVPAANAFSGFADPAVITVIEILLIVQVLSRSALLDRLAQRISSARLGTASTIGTLCGLSATISVFMNNIGALALMIPIVYGVCRANGIDPRIVLMPVSFAALLGGLCSVIGTPANLIVSRQLAAETGTGFAFFDFGWAGVPAALAGLVAIVLWAPRMLMGSSGLQTEARAPLSRRVVAEMLVPRGSRLVGTALADFPAKLHSVLRDDRRLFLQRKDQVLEVGDRVLIEDDQYNLDELAASGVLSLSAGSSDRSTVQAVVMPESTVVGSRIGTIAAFGARDIRVVAVSPQSHRIEGSLADLQLSIGDVLHLEGEATTIGEALDETEMLALSPLPLPSQHSTPPFALFVFAAGIVLAALGPVPPQIAFGLVVLVLAGAGILNLRTGLADLNWPILIMLASMIPLGAAVESTEAAGYLADSVLSAIPSDEPVVLVSATLFLAVLITPLVNNASTALVLGPIAIAIARSSGLPPEPFLIAVALGASIDFLTPFGHHNNTLVMGLAGYRFGEFARAGWPVTFASVAAAILALACFWP